MISAVIDRIIHEDGGKFVKLDVSSPSKWIYASDRLCREKCSQTFRDSLHEVYRSSSVAKKNKRRLEQQQQEHEQIIAPNPSDKREVAPRAAKKMRLDEPVVQLAPTSWENPSFFDRLLTSTTKPKVMDLPKKRDNLNLFSILSDLVNIPLSDEDPFEPTPLSSSDFSDMNASSVIERAPDPFLDEDMLYPQTSCISSHPCSDSQKHHSFMMDNDEGALHWDDEELVVSPMLTAAFAA